MNKKSKLGYSNNSPFRNEDSIIIDSNNITMENTSIDLYGIPIYKDGSKGNPVLMKAGNKKNYVFPDAISVLEIPIDKMKKNKKFYFQTAGKFNPDTKNYQFPKEGDPIPEVVKKRLDQFRSGGADTSSSCIGAACYEYGKQNDLNFEKSKEIRFPQDKTVYGNPRIASAYASMGLNRTTTPVEGSIIQLTKTKKDEKGNFYDNPYHAGLVKKIKENGDIVVLHTGGGDNWKESTYKKDLSTGQYVSSDGYWVGDNAYFYKKGKVPASETLFNIDNSDVDYNINVSEIVDYNSLTNEGRAFIDTLKDRNAVNRIRQLTGMSLQDYDKYAKYAIATASEESELGKGLLYRSGIDDFFGDSKGLIQFNWDLHVESKDKEGNYINKEFKQKLDSLGINRDNFTKPENQAKLFMIFAPMNERYSESFYKKGNQKDPTKDTRIKTRPLIKAPAGFELLEKIDRTLGLTSTKKYPISGNSPDLSDSSKFRYGYKEPGALRYGDAEGKSLSVQNFNNVLQKIKSSVNNMSADEFFKKLKEIQKREKSDEQLWREMGYKTGGKFKFQQGSVFDIAPRQGVRKNPDGSVSTHKMKAEIVDGVWYVFPTVFQNQDGTWVNEHDEKIMKNERDWMSAYKEARKRGEVISFGKGEEAAKKAIDFSKGSWKTEYNVRQKQLENPDKFKFKSGGTLNQGKKDKLFVLSKTNRNHTLDGWSISKGNEPVKDNTKSTAGYLQDLKDKTGTKQVGENLYIKNQYQGGGITTTYLPEIEVTAKQKGKPTAQDLVKRGRWLVSQGYNAKDFKKLSKVDQEALMGALTRSNREQLGKTLKEETIPFYLAFDEGSKGNYVNAGVLAALEFLPFDTLGKKVVKSIGSLLKNNPGKKEFLNELVTIVGDKKKANEIYTKVKSKEFKEYFGDWEKGDVNIDKYNEIVDISDRITKAVPDAQISGSPALNAQGELRRNYKTEGVHDLDFNVFSNEQKQKKYGEDTFEDTFTPVEMMALNLDNIKKENWYKNIKLEFPNMEIFESSFINYNKPSNTATKTFIGKLPTKNNNLLHLDFFHSLHPADYTTVGGKRFRKDTDVLNIKKDPMFSRPKDIKDIENYTPYDETSFIKESKQTALSPFIQFNKVTNEKGYPKIFKMNNKFYFKNYAGQYKEVDARSFDTNTLRTNYQQGGQMKKFRFTKKYQTGGVSTNANMVLLDHVGNPQMYMKGGELIYSRPSTKKIVDLASKAKTDEDFYKLGKTVYDERMAQRKRDKE